MTHIVRQSVRPSVRPSVSPSVCLSVGWSRGIFKQRCYHYYHFHEIKALSLSRIVLDSLLILIEFHALQNMGSGILCCLKVTRDQQTDGHTDR